MDLIHEGNEIIQQIVELLNEHSPESCPSGIDFTNFVVANADRLPTDAATVVTLAAELEAQLMEHEGTIH
jgi:hypothetical protein|tara:strand:+ start:79 stop:288 length:210 start_codon:yes stop_codon:yes gene_type:complete